MWPFVNAALQVGALLVVASAFRVHEDRREGRGDWAMHIGAVLFGAGIAAAILGA